jgi:nicotinate-nucleotide adenylyltransferase
MLRLALGEFPNLEIDDRETRRNGPSYMVDTLHELHTEFRGRPILLLLGQDVANDLHTWHEWERLFDFAHIVVLTRPGSVAEYRQDVAKKIDRRTCIDAQKLLDSQAGGVLYLAVTSVDVSATMIKSIIRLGRAPALMMPRAVWNYISENHLYLPV